MTMPEEINRICTDAIADVLFTTDLSANENLLREGVASARIHFVGNVMIDSLLVYRDIARRLAFHSTLGLRPGQFATLTLHRPSNVDHRETLIEILDAIQDSMPDMPIVFPIHPRTRSRLREFELEGRFTHSPGTTGIFLVEPLSYVEFLSLNQHARLVLTDSGGLQEEATILGIPCVTLRENTERPITITHGTNRLSGTTRTGILGAVAEALAHSPTEHGRPDKWDGNAAERIVEIIGRGIKK
jgi:UDP-N-acetylglucosamine 2-epimerase (non-hydrolysing)